MQKVKIKTVGRYHGHNIKANKSVDLTLKLEYSELVNYMQLVQLLNENITIAIRIGKSKPFKVGIFMIKNIKIDNDGEGTVVFNSTLDYVEADLLNNLAGEILNFLFVADIDTEDDESEELA